MFLGIECGATRSTAILARADGSPVARVVFGPANLRLLNDRRLQAHLKSIRDNVSLPVALAIGMAGARTESDRQRIRNASSKVWPGIPCCATNDLETALAAAEEISNAKARVLVLSGTGSCCFGRNRHGKTSKVGGWGHILGDKGSAYEIGLRALKAVVYYYDTEGEWSVLGQRILRALQLNEADDLIPWVQSASKPEIAALALEVFQAAADREAIARDILAGAAGSLVNDAVACARNLAGPGTPVQFVFAGSVLLQQPRFAKKISSQLHQRWPKAVITPLQRESVWGAVELALQFGAESKSTSVISEKPSDDKVRIGNSKAEPSELARARVNGLSQMLVGSPTERRNPSSMNLDRMPLPQAIQLMLREDAKIPGSIRQERKKIERAIGMIVRAFRQEGRLFYVGAGSSGRLGVLDASECPPTFQAAPSMVQGIIAGGQRALWEAVEGAEDDPDAGARAIEFRGVSSRDVVVGIAASGSTPFVWGALNAAKNHKALTVLLCFNPQLQKIAKAKVDLVIAPDVGPEILTGSTRLKAGTATKIILNMFTTLAMVRLGKVLGNLMIDLKPSNAKLRDRATRIVQQLTGADYARARSALEKAGWQIKQVIRQQRRR